MQQCIQSLLVKRLRSDVVKSHRYFRTLPNSLCTSNTTTPPPVVQDADKFISTVLSTCRSGSIFAGTGQYHESTVEDRILMLNFGENFLTDPDVSLFDTTPLLDCCVKPSDLDTLLEDVKLHSNLPVYNGEVDFINKSDWQYGFTLKPFSIFSGDERICFIKADQIYTSFEGKTEVIDIKDIEYVGLFVSDEPYNERKLLLGLKGKPSKTLLFVERHDTQCDLGELTVDTEWMMKTAALLCVNLTRYGNDKVHLKLSPVLLPGNNPWVAMRHKLWIEMIQKNTWEKDF